MRYDSPHDLFRDAHGREIDSQQEFYKSSIAMYLQQKLTDKAVERFSSEQLLETSDAFLERVHVTSTGINTKSTDELDELAEDAVLSHARVEMTVFIRQNTEEDLSDIDELTR